MSAGGAVRERALGPAGWCGVSAGGVVRERALGLVGWCGIGAGGAAPEAVVVRRGGAA